MKITDVYNVGVSPSSLIVMPDNKIAYVCNSNNYGILGSDSVSVLDLEKGVNKNIIKHESFNQPYRLANYKNKIYVTNSGSPSILGQQGTVTVIDTKTDKVESVISGFDGPSAIVITHNKMYVTNYGAAGGVGSGNGKTISVVDLITHNIIKTITTDLAPAALSLCPCKKHLYSVNYITGLPGKGTINIISLKTNRITDTITGLSGPFGIVVNKNNIAYVTNFGSNNFAPYGTTLSVIDMTEGYIIKNVEVGIQPAGICLSPCENFAYISTYNALYADPINFNNLTYGEATVSILDTKCNNLIDGAIKVGQTASTIVSSSNGYLYVTSYTLNIVQSIEL